MEKHTDSTFIRNIIIVLALLVLVTFSIFYIAKDEGFKEEQADSTELIEKRIRPVADVYTGEDGAAAIEAATAVTDVEPVLMSEDGPDGEKIYTSACAACHATGVAGAPIPGSEAMSRRAEKGLDALLQSALNGLNAMPPRGGRSDLSDEQIKAVIEFMLQ